MKVIPIEYCFMCPHCVVQKIHITDTGVEKIYVCTDLNLQVIPDVTVIMAGCKKPDASLYDIEIERK